MRSTIICNDEDIARRYYRIIKKIILQAVDDESGKVVQLIFKDLWRDLIDSGAPEFEYKEAVVT